jgi:hypothetical protein
MQVATLLSYVSVDANNDRLKAHFHPDLQRRGSSFYYYCLYAVVQLNNSLRQTLLGQISGSHGDEYEDDCLLECCAV